MRCYQQSLFTLVHTVYPDIKILGLAVKKLKGQLVYDGGFPQRVLHNLLPEDVTTPWGAEADSDVLVEGAYLAWESGDAGARWCSSAAVRNESPR